MKPARILLLLVPLNAVALWIGNYGDSFGERDSYRVFVGVADAMLHNANFTGPLMYGADASPGYYLLLHFLISAFGIDVHHLIGALNALALVCSLLCLVPLFVAVRAIGGEAAALAALALIYLVPVWRSVAEYAHPEWLAVLFYLTALALAAVRPQLSRLGRPICDIGIALSLAVAFSMRLDAVLMAPMMLAFCVEGGRFAIASCIRLLACGSVALAGFIGLAALHPDPALAQQGQSVWQLFAAFHAPGRFLSEFKTALFSFATGVNPFLLVAYLASVLYILARREQRALLMSVPTVALGYIFWIPNANPRHYLFLAPAFISALAWTAGDMIEQGIEPARVRGLHVSLLILALGVDAALSPLLRGRFLLFEAGLLAILLLVATLPVLREAVPRFAAVASAGLIVTAGLALFIGVTHRARLAMRNQFPPRMAPHYMQLARPLLDLPALGQPVLVIADAYPIIAAMQLSSPRPLSIVPRRSFTLLQVTTDRNDFQFYVQGWDQSAAIAAARELSATRKINVLVDGTTAPQAAMDLSGMPNIHFLAWP